MTIAGMTEVTTEQQLFLLTPNNIPIDLKH